MERHKSQIEETRLDVKRPLSVTHPNDMSHPFQVPTAYRTYPSRVLAELLDESGVCCVATPTFSTITLTRRTFSISPLEEKEETCCAL